MGILHTCACRTAQQFLRLKRFVTPSPKQHREIGEDAVYQIAPYLRNQKLKRPLILLSDAEQPLLLRLELSLRDSDIEYHIWNRLPTHPSAADGENARLFYLGNNCDCIIAMGSDPVMNIARLIALRTATPNVTIEQVLRSGRVPNVKLPPVITVPTVPGSGVESCSTAFLHPEGSRLACVVHRRLRPACIVSDPNLLDNASREQIADACALGLCHAFESYLSPYADRRTRFYVLRAIQYYFDTLEGVYNTGGTPGERKLLLEASVLSGQASAAVSCGYITALVRAVAELTDLRPADAIGALLPTFLVKYGNSIFNRLGRLALFMEIGQDCGDEELTTRVILRLRTLFFRIGLADTLDVKDTSLLSAIAYRAAAIANPRWASPVVWTADELYEILLASV